MQQKQVYNRERITEGMIRTEQTEMFRLLLLRPIADKSDPADPEHVI